MTNEKKAKVKAKTKDIGSGILLALLGAATVLASSDFLDAGMIEAVCGCPVCEETEVVAPDPDPDPTPAPAPEAS